MQFRRKFLTTSTIIGLSLTLTLPAWADQMLKFTVQSETTTMGKTEKDPPTKQSKTTSETITLGDKYFIVEDNGSKRIYNLAEKQVLSLDDKNKKVQRSSLYADVYFRIMEFQNRKMLGAITEKAGINAGFGGQFSNESLFCISLPPQKNQLKAESKADSDGTVHFSFEKEEWVTYKPSKELVDPKYKATYGTMLSLMFQIHPSVRDALMALNIPSELKYQYSNTLNKGTRDFKLERVAEVPPSNPVPPSGYTETYPENLAPVHQALKNAITAGFPSKKAVNDSIDASIKAKNYLEAFLTILDYGLSSGNQMTAEMRSIKDNIQSDPQCVKYLADYAPKKSDADVKKAIDSLNSIDRTKLKHAHVIDIMLANDYEALKQNDKARQLFISVLSKHPLITGAYHDLGQNYLGAFDMYSAWDCFDMADTVNGNLEMMKPIHAMEKKMEADFPEFF